MAFRVTARLAQRLGTMAPMQTVWTGKSKRTGTFSPVDSLRSFLLFPAPLLRSFPSFSSFLLFSYFFLSFTFLPFAFLFFLFPSSSFSSLLPFSSYFYHPLHFLNFHKLILFNTALSDTTLYFIISYYIISCQIMLSYIICSTIYGQSLIFHVSLVSLLSPLSLLLWESYLRYEFFDTSFFVPTNNVFLYVSFKISSHSISLAHVYCSSIPFPTHLFSPLLLHLPDRKSVV